MSLKSVLVVGATGKQGGAVIRSLLARKTNVQILALTRDTTTSRAQGLVQKQPDRIRLVQGDVTSPAAIFAQKPKGSIHSLFLVTSPPKEEPQGIPMIDAALAHGVQHIVFSSVDRGGDQRSWENPTNVEHFYEKHNIELHLRKVTASAAATGGSAAQKVTWTILRPVAFMDNMQPEPSFVCAIFVSIWNVKLGRTKKLQLIGTRDIGLWAAKAVEAFADPAAAAEKPKYENKAIGLAGDELSLDQVQTIFRKVQGQDIPWAWTLVGYLLLLFMGEMRRMFDFFVNEGYGVDISALRAEEPSLCDFETWLREESGWKNQKKQ